MLSANNFLLLVLAVLSAGGIIYNLYVGFYDFVLKKQVKTRDGKAADYLLLWPGLLGALVLTAYPFSHWEKWAWVPILLDFSCLIITTASFMVLGFFVSDLKEGFRQRFKQILPRRNRSKD